MTCYVLFVIDLKTRRAEIAGITYVERAHQGLGNERIEASEVGQGEVRCSERLGGILKHDSRTA